MKTLETYSLEELTVSEKNEIIGGGVLEDFFYETGRLIGSSISKIEGCIEKLRIKNRQRMAMGVTCEQK
ncbi:MAG: hypothetical protein MUF43_11815 [Flavobacterium sp.]|jgi:hypothetical protein|nr:hypothetical protein [Flavobacterium sp.]